MQVLHQRRTQLVERETLLQRWVVALEMEAARQTSLARQLQQREGKVCLQGCKVLQALKEESTE